MASKYTHIAIIPARAGSVGLPGKNRLFFDNTADYLDNISWFDNILVTTDDTVVKSKAKERNYIVHNRPERLAGPAISIKAVFEDLVQSREFSNNVVFWLFYLPVLYKRQADFEEARTIIERDEVRSVCTFVPAQTHPYTTWKYDEKSNKLQKFIENDVFRRQDMPPAWMHYHYVCCFKIDELASLDNELLNENTFPIFLSEEDAGKLVEVDTPEDLAKWESIQNKEKQSI